MIASGYPDPFVPRPRHWPSATRRGTVSFYEIKISSKPKNKRANLTLKCPFYREKVTKAEKIYIKSMDFALGKISYDEFVSQVMQINNN
ncbi:sialate O-acetylesterase [Desulfitobacterium sp. AusDCA]